MIVRDGIDIEAPIDTVWRVFTDVERWPEWTDSVSSISFVSGEPLAHGSVVEISQPRFPKLKWVVTDFSPGTAWSWTSRSPGATTVATHVLTAMDASNTRVEQSIDQRGVFGGLVGRLVIGLTRRYLAMEAAGLKKACEAQWAQADRDRSEPDSGG